jgi:hypothetical protein
MAKHQPQAQRSFHRTAPKSQEKDLIDNARYLQQHPDAILPQPQDTDYFAKIRKHLTTITSLHDNPDRLKKLSNKKSLEGAVAGTLLLLTQEKAPVLGYMTFSTGETVMYAQRGKADKEHFVAAQHPQDPIYRLLGIYTLAKKKHLSVYSWDNGYLCTGKTPHPPKDFLTFLTKKLNLTHTTNTATCPHLTPTIVTQKTPITIPYLRLHWQSADLTIGICETCTHTRANTLITMTKYFIQPKLSNDILVDVISTYSAAHHATTKELQKAATSYFSGQLTDTQYIAQRARHQHTSVKQQTDRVYMAQGTSYGTDTQAFIDALQPTPEERQALTYILTKIQEPVIIPHKTPANVFELYWTPHGKDFITTIVTDPTYANTLTHMHDSPSTIIKLAFEWKTHQDTLNTLPTYTNLPALASFADTITRIAKTEGTQKATRELKRRPDTPQGKSLEYAFLLAFNQDKDAKWKFTTEEINYGEFLKPKVQTLLAATPDTYTTALQALLTASGSTETITQNTQ